MRSIKYCGFTLRFVIFSKTAGSGIPYYAIIFLNVGISQFVQVTGNLTFRIWGRILKILKTPKPFNELT